MAYQISKEDIWVGEVEDRPGGLADKLEPLSGAGSELEFVIARRAQDKPGTTILFLAPLQGTDLTHAAERAGLSKWTTASSLRIEGADQLGLGAKIARAMGNAGINMRGLSAAKVGDRAQVHIALDSVADADRAGEVLNKALNG